MLENARRVFSFPSDVRSERKSLRKRKKGEEKKTIYLYQLDPTVFSFTGQSRLKGGLEKGKQIDTNVRQAAKQFTEIVKILSVSPAKK